MKFLIQLWKFLSFPIIMVGLALVWYGIHSWPLTSTDKVVSASELFVDHADVMLLKDSVRFDLRRASIRQENFMGIKSPAVAVFPAWAGKDTGAAKLVIVSSRPEFLGPAVKSFQRVDSGDGAVHVQSSGNTSTGLLVPRFEALVQVLAAQLRPHLLDSTRGKVLVEGTAIRKTDPEAVGIDSVASQYWEVRLEGVPGRGKVVSLFVLGLAVVGLGIVLQMITKKWDARRAEEEEEERANEKPLV